MIKLFYKTWHCLLTLLALTSMYSCTKEGRETVMTDVSFVLGPEAGSTAESNCVFGESWQITSVPEGYTVSPMSGESGSVSLTVTALTTNTGLGERVRNVTAMCGGEMRMTIIQRGLPGIVPAYIHYNALSVGDTVSITVNANVEFEVLPDCEWLEVLEINANDSTLLSDGKTCSDSLLYTVTVAVQANTESTERTGKVVMRYESEIVDVFIEQSAPLAVDWGKDFFRTSVFIRMTATWCYNCPYMSEAISRVANEMQGRIIPVNVHSLSSEGGLAYYKSPDIEELYGIEGYPTGVANNMVKFKNIRSVDELAVIVRDVTQDAISFYPSRTAIHALSKLDNDSIYLDIEIAAKDAGQHSVCIMLLENGILYEQAGTGSGDYTHDAVLREILTGDLNGASLPESSGNDVLHYSLHAGIPRSVLNPNNLSIVIVTGRNCILDTKNVQTAEYLDLGTVWDNAAILPANGSVDLAYEE